MESRASVAASPSRSLGTVFATTGLGTGSDSRVLGAASSSRVRGTASAAGCLAKFLLPWVLALHVLEESGSALLCLEEVFLGAASARALVISLLSSSSGGPRVPSLFLHRVVSALLHISEFWVLRCVGCDVVLCLASTFVVPSSVLESSRQRFFFKAS